MGKERDSVVVGPCLCGTGSVKEHIWANDHAFATDYGWRSSGVSIHCDACTQKWVIATTAANPVEAPPGLVAAYFVAREEAEKVSKHNAVLEQQIQALAAESSRLETDLKTRVRAVQAYLISRADSAGSGIAAKFNSVGAALGFNDLDAFRAATGRSRPATYIESLVTLTTVRRVLRNLNRDSEASAFAEVREKMRTNAQESAALNAATLAPTAVKPLLYVPHGQLD